MVFQDYKQKKQVFHKESSSRNTGKYSYNYIFFVVFKLEKQFLKGAQLQRSFDIYIGICMSFALWASRALVYNGGNLWMVDLCSVDLRSWNWRGVDKAVNFMVILQGGLNFIIQVSLWAHITSLGCRRQTILQYDRLVMFYCITGYFMI